jgi:hypothetical protein
MADAGRDEGGSWPGGGTLAAVLVVYTTALVVATYPAARNLSTRLPSLSDPQMHLWVMRWYKACLLEGRAPALCPDVQYPVGAPLGYFSPMHLQAVLYLGLSFVLNNDVFIYNILWFAGLLGTGLGTFALAWHLLRDRVCAGVAGLLAMLSGPALIHGIGHLELVWLGGFPLFLVAWLRLVERPGGGRLAAAAGLYVVTAMSAAYFAVLAAVPAAFLLAWRAAGAVRRRDGGWLRVRAGWLAAFAALVLPALALLFSGNLWAASHGFEVARSWDDFARNPAPPWTFAAPTPLHGLSALLPFDVYAAAGYRFAIIEQSSYLGVVALALLQYAAIHRTGPPRAGSWWALLALLVVLAWGAQWRIGDGAVTLPAGWLWRACYPFRLIRMPARFNLLAAVIAAVLAASGLRHLRARLRRPAARALVTAAVVAVAVADLSLAPYGARYAPPALPPFYAELARRDPGAAFLEVPLDLSYNAHPISTLGGYWQSFHRARTSGGYSGLPNRRFDDQVVRNSPFWAARLADPGYLDHPEAMPLDLASGVAFDDYAWLYLKALGFRYVVVHRRSVALRKPPPALERLRERLRPARVVEDLAADVFDRERLPRPSRPVLVCTDGWRRPDGPAAVVGRAARIAAYNPDPGREVIFTLEAQATARARTVRLRCGGEELASWRIGFDARGSYTSPPLRLPAEVRELVLECGEDGVAGDPAAGAGRLRVFGVGLRPAAAVLARGGDRVIGR